MAEDLFEAGAEVLFDGAAYVIDAVVDGAAYLVSRSDGHIEKVDLNDLEESQEGLPNFPVTINTFAHASKWSVFASEDWDAEKFPFDLAEKLGYLHYEVKFTTRIDQNHCVTITHINDVPISQEVSDALVQN